MYRRILVCLLAAAFLAIGQQTVTVQKLIEFVKSQVQLIKQKKGTDKELALSLASIRLSEKLDVSVIEDLQADGAGPLTVKALQRLQQQTGSLKEAVIAKPEVYVPPPPPSSVEQGKILDDVRQYVANYDNSIPDFICLEIEQRAIAPNHGGRSGNDPSFRPLDTITSKITYFHHEEKKEPILNGSRPVNTDYEKLGGATSRGDFETALRCSSTPPPRRASSGLAGQPCVPGSPWSSATMFRGIVRSTASGRGNTRSNGLQPIREKSSSMHSRRIP